MKRYIDNRYLTFFFFIRAFILKVEYLVINICLIKIGLCLVFLLVFHSFFLYIDCDFLCE